MTPIINKPTLAPEVAQSFRALQSTARGSEQIAEWFTRNMAHFGELPEHVPESLKVSVRMDREVVSVLMSKNDQGFAASLELSMMTQPLPPSALSELVGLSGLTQPNALRLMSQFALNFEEWPFTIAEMAFDYVSNAGYVDNITPEWHNHSKMLIERYFPTHFPGMSLAKLETLAEMELLPKDESANLKVNRLALDKQQFFDMLFATRSGHALNPLPPDLGM